MHEIESTMDKKESAKNENYNKPDEPINKENHQQTKDGDNSKDHIMVISDWYHQTSVEVLTRLRNEFYTYG